MAANAIEDHEIARHSSKIADEGLDTPDSLPSKDSERDLEAADVADKPGVPAAQLADQTNFLPARQVIIVFCGLSLGVFLAFLEQTVLGTALFAITADLGGGKDSAWVITSYLLVSTALTPIYGRLSDIFGRKAVLLVCLAEFFLSSLACAVAQSTIQLIIFRALQGIGGGSIITITLIIISDIVSLRDRGRYQGILEVIITLASGLGPVLGGLFAEVGWRYIFWINLPICGVCILVTWRLLPLRKVEGNYKQKLARIDYIGCALVLIASVLFLLGLNWGGVTYPWVSAPVLATLLIGGALYCAFIIYERVPAFPIVKLSVFRHRTVCGVMVLTASNGAFHYGMLYYLPQYLIVVKNYSTIRAGVLTLPYLCTVAPSVFTCGQLISITGRYRPQIFVGTPGLVIGSALLYTLNETSSMGKIVGIEVFLGLSAGCLFQTSLVALQTAVTRAEMAVATSVRNFFRLLAGTIYLAVAAALLQNSLNSVTLTEAVRTEIRNDPAKIRSLGLDEALTAEVLKAYVDGFKLIFLVITVLCGIGCIASYALIKHHNLTRPDDEQSKAQSKLWLEERKQNKRTKEQQKESDKADVA